jgi:hypothetical protein
MMMMMMMMMVTRRIAFVMMRRAMLTVMRMAAVFLFSKSRVFLFSDWRRDLVRAVRRACTRYGFCWLRGDDFRFSYLVRRRNRVHADDGEAKRERSTLQEFQHLGDSNVGRHYSQKLKKVKSCTAHACVLTTPLH